MLKETICGIGHYTYVLAMDRTSHQQLAGGPSINILSGCLKTFYIVFLFCRFNVYIEFFQYAYLLNRSTP